MFCLQCGGLVKPRDFKLSPPALTLRSKDRHVDNAKRHRESSAPLSRRRSSALCRNVHSAPSRVRPCLCLLVLGWLSWSDRLEYRRSINQVAVVHHLPDPARVTNIRERIGVKEDEIGPLTHFDSAEILIRAEYARGAARASMDRLRRR